MIKGIFVTGKLGEEKLTQVSELRVNAVFTHHKNLEKNWPRILQRQNVKVYAEVSLFVGKDLWQKHSDTHPIDRNGKPLEKVGWYAGVCPNHPKVRQEKLELIGSIIKQFNVDGIWLDFIRYPCHWEVPNPDLTEYCFCPNCLGKFKQEVGGEPSGDSWTKWRCAQITSFTANVSTLIRQSGKNLELGMFVVPWRDIDFDEAITRVIGQDFNSLVKYIDIFSPMVYHKMCGKPPVWINEVVKYMAEITEKPILPIIQTEDKPGKISGEEFKEELEEAIKKPSAGAIAFFLEDLLKNKNKFSALSRIL